LPTCHTQAEPFRAFVEVIVSGDSETAIRLLNASSDLAKERAARGAIRQAPKENFFDRIKHYINEGDTALHMAAAAKQTRIAEELISRGADVRARNRRGAEPLHYAVDGGPGSPVWDPNEQTMIIARLIRAGAVPVRRVGRDVDRVAGVQDLWPLAFEADAPDTGETEQGLPDWVRMPSGPRARREGDDRATEP